ncbi:hypothetical protein [Streptomyces sp. AF1A]|jgi:hypothetical protein|uniref:hypothetical protein n=1 Tax=Streptomyces sp. AF1A TaxID=3394350 RepID=UPI0039BC5227
MRRSTLFTRAFGGAALACAAVALSLVFLRYDAPAPRWDILTALAAAAVTAGAWALACRAAPPLGPAPSAATQESSVPPLPRRLPLPARDVGRTTGAVLLLLTPLVLTRLAAGSGGVLSGVLIVLVLVVTVKTLLFARRRVSDADVRSKLRVLAEDAGRGELHGVRVRVGEPVRMRYSKRGDKPGELSVTQFHWLVLRAGGREIKFAVSPQEAGSAAVRLGGQEGWLCWPERWKLIDEELPAALVADTGEVAMGLTDPDEARPYLTGTGTGTGRPAVSDRPAQRLARAAKFSGPVHTRILGGALLAALIATPVLYVGPDRLHWALDWLLCGLAAASVVVFSLRGLAEASEALPDGVTWTVQEESDPSIA